MAEGTPEEVKLHPRSHTAKALREYDSTLGLGSLIAGEARGRNWGLTNQDNDCAERGTNWNLAQFERFQSQRHPDRQRHASTTSRTLSVDIPHNKFSVMTGVSGSGKSTLAFDILFNEGQRRYLESLNAYARSIVQPAGRPEVDAVYGIPPTVAIEQRLSRGGRKSTVGTTTEVWHFLRLLYVKLGVQHCVNDGAEVRPQTPDSIAAQLIKRYRGQHIGLLAPLVVNRKGVYTELADWARPRGYTHLRVDGNFLPTTRLSAHRPLQGAHHRVAGVRPGRDARQRGAAAREADAGAGTRQGRGARAGAAGRPARRDAAGRGLAPTHRQGGGLLHAARLPGLQHQLSPSWTRACSPTTASTAGAPTAWAPASSSRASSARPSTTRCRPTTTRAASRPSPSRRSRTSPTKSAPACHGARLNLQARHVQFDQTGIAEIAALSVVDVRRWIESLQVKGVLSVREQGIARDLIPEIRSRLEFLEEVGLGYLTLDRGAPTLSGGEAQRIRLAAQLGSNLQGVCYVLDEPTIGLHARDNQILLDALHQLGDKGNTLVVVEHDEDTIRSADHIIDIGPSAGKRGGRVVAQGSAADMSAVAESVTGRYLLQR